ncbi:EpsG family protein [Enterobacter cloacae]|uniref:EpsG family protein n=1 Tax=Enterobacter cloacae TaxID=550 RepID=UPI0010EBEFF9|nr:EpsG family protein [Enterobacter cloacae]MCD1393025.1 EpsG family protein [Enterobacter cloacae]MCK6748575.1 EpsG family protein [Enterobacter cloacae]MCK6801137.1 EpsG family protein [Enterobacter cloacae]MCK6986625.1 EpsG family protein [Enterobacter cloacae]MCL8177459.1 EpsG family protein [Enterobacter cloacae]
MIWYYLPLIPLFLGMIAPKRNVFLNGKYVFQNDRFYLWLFLLTIFILTGFKGNIDPDYQNYLFYYHTIPKFDELNESNLNAIKDITSNVELSVIYGMSFLKIFGLGFQFYYIVSALVSIFLISKISSYFDGSECIVGLVIYCFYIQPFFIQVRYLGGALCGIICILEYFNKGKINRTVIFYFLLGMLLHTVVVFTVPLLLGKWLYSLIRKNLFLILLIPCLLALVNVDSILQYTYYVSDRYVNYLNASSSQKELGSIFSFAVREAIVVFLIAGFALSNRFSLEGLNNIRHSKALIFMLLSMLSIWAFAWQFGMLYRVALMFEIGWLLFLLQGKKNVSFYFSWGVLLPYMIFRLYVGLAELKGFKFADGWVY